MAVEWHLETLPLASLTAWHKNPRQLSKTQYDQLRVSLDKYGLIEKPVVNADPDNTVIGGHQRLRVLYDQGVREVECWVPERELSVRDIEELNIRLNRNLGSWDFDILANEFEIEDLLDWGFSEIELQIDTLADAMGGDNSEDSGSEGGGNGPCCSYELIVECDSKVARAQLASRLGAEGYTCRMETGVASVAADSDFDVLPEIQWR